MKRLTEPKAQEVKNAWGGFAHVVLTDHEVEESDVGRQKLHYMGHGRYAHTFTMADVGRKLREDSSSCGFWCFLD